MFLSNQGNSTLISVLQKEIHPTSKVSILTGIFSIFGFSALKKELSTNSEFRMMISSWNERSLYLIAGIIQETSLKNRLDQRYIANQCLNWLNNAIGIRAVTNQMDYPPQNLFHIQNSDREFAIQAGSHFTASGLGVVQSNTHEMNTGHRDPEDTAQMRHWFNAIWNDSNITKDIKPVLLEQLQYIASEKTANLVYFVTLYNIFKNYLEDINEDSILRSKTGFKDTFIWNKLYKFQRDGVMGAIDKLEKYNGCIIADSVGLGKTFEALAVIKYYELRNDRVLILCPKKLRDNWTVYTVNDKRNLFARDRFNYDVLNHTDLSRSSGKSGEINLKTLHWGNYDLLVIDESHNFRNTGTKSNSATRYQKLMQDIIQSGVKTKVLMLSATPVNSRMNDLKNQVAFITEGHDNALSDAGLFSIENTLKKAQKKFNQWLKLPVSERTTDTLLESMNFDYFKLLDLLTIARSRKHIEKYYDIKEIGKFPDRLKPYNIKSDIDTTGRFPPLKEVNRSIKRLNLSVYAPLEYLRHDKKEEYSRKYDQTVKGGASVFRQVDRERNLIHLMRVNILKRMESSIHSFSKTVGAIKDKIQGILKQIEEYQAMDYLVLNIETIEIDDPLLEDYLIGNKTKILIQDMDVIRWKQDLTDDLILFEELLTNSLAVNPERDKKLQHLKEVIKNKSFNPMNPGNKKVMVFTAFSDTAEYLYEHIGLWAQDTLCLESALITGNDSNRCTVKGIKKDLNTLLTNFSPLSKERNSAESYTEYNIDILIATDCISEGQNLQDCDLLINYDIHWNPVRIIQRFGRIDRLGSQNNVIQLTNFWPNMELDEYINLETRVSGRMVLLDISATGEENVINYTEKDQMNDLEYRRRQMEQLQNAVIDLEDMDGSMSITDMTLNDFRMDLSSFMKENKAQLLRSPSGFYAVVQKSDDVIPGTIFCLRDINGIVEFDPNYALAPHYIVYVAEDGHIIFNHLQGKRSLDIFKKLASVNNVVNNNAVTQLNHVTQHGKNMSVYQSMLESAIQSIMGKVEEKGIQSLFSRGGTTMAQETISAINNFEVVSYLIIQKEQP